jgi:Tfp pilus assembly protein PilV
MAKPTKRRSKGKALTSVKTWDDSLSEDVPPRTRSHCSSSRSSRSSHKCLMERGKTSIPSSSDDNDSECDDEESPP